MFRWLRLLVVLLVVGACNPNTPILRTLSGVDCSPATVEQSGGKCKYVR